MPGRGRSSKWWRIYHGVKRSGKSKTSAAKIASSKTKKRGRKKKK